MKKIVRLTETELVKLVKRVIKEQHEDLYDKAMKMLEKHGIEVMDMDEMEIFGELKRLFHRVEDWKSKEEILDLINNIESEYGSLPTDDFRKIHHKFFKRRGLDSGPSSDKSFEDLMNEL